MVPGTALTLAHRSTGHRLVASGERVMSGGLGGAGGATNGAGGTIDPTTGAANPGSTPTGQAARGGGGGGGSAGGGAGAAGQTVFGTGAGPTMPMQLQGGSGGAGGTNLIAPVAVSTGSNATSGTAGTGVAGQPGTAARNPATGAPGQDDIGGGGGEGGYGLILTGSGSNGANVAFRNTGALTGGTGGAGGFDTSGSANAVSGEGGDGGIALDVLGSYVTLTNAAALTGGTAGTGALSTFNSSGLASTTYGKGGAAIAGANLTINNSANLTGGLNGDGTRGAAIDFTGGANTLKITSGTVTGGIIDTGSLTLASGSQSNATYSGISGSGNVDIALDSTVYLLGTNTYAGGTTVDGYLSLGNGTTAGTLAGPVTLNSGSTLDLYLPASSSATLDAVSGSGSFFIEPESSVTIVSDNLTAGGMFSGTYNFGTLTIEGGTDSGIVQNGGTLNLAQTGATPLTISGVISDLNGEGGPVVGTVVAQSGITILSGANTYTGATYLDGGVINAENAAAFGTGTVYAIDPEIDYGPAAGSTATSATQTNAIVLDVASPATADPTILKVASGFTETISGNITTGSGTNSAGQTIDSKQSLVVNGAGTLVLSGANSYSGGLTLGGSGTLELASATAAGASNGSGTNGAVAFATGSTATLGIDQAALSSTTYADPIRNFAYREAIDLAGFTYVSGKTTATLTGSDLVASTSGTSTSESLTNFADATGQSGTFTTASDGNGGTLVTLLTPPPAAPTNLAAKGTPTLNGTAEITGIGDAAGDTITLYADGGTTAVGSGTISADGAFDITTTSTFGDGSHAFTATETSTATGLTSANSGGSTLYSFKPQGDGNYPEAGLFADAAGNLFGTTDEGGSGEVYGTVFEIANTGTLANPNYSTTETTLVSFYGTNGANPHGVLIADAAGDLFGTADDGGAGESGTVFELKDTNGTYATSPTTLYSFTGGNDGAEPTGSLIADTTGDLFGTTEDGGTGGGGTVFELKETNGTYATAPITLYSFTGGNDGLRPTGSLIADAAGDLFGTAKYDGAGNSGTVFEIKDTNGTYATAPTILYSFTYGSDGGNPNGSLIADANGDLFGTTETTAFEIVKNANGTYAAAPTTLATFGDAEPQAGLVADSKGDLFGTTAYGGADNDGSVFEIVNTGTTSAPAYANGAITLESFTGTNGSDPESALIIDGAGHLIGTASHGGANYVGNGDHVNDNGTVFETNPTGTASVLIAAAAPTLTGVVGTANNGGPLEVQGTTADAANDTITLYNGTTIVGTGFVRAGTGGGANTFDFTTNALADGTYHLTATATSGDGTTTSPTSNTLTAIVSAPAPTGLHQVGTANGGGTIEIAGTGDAQGDTITLYNGTSATPANKVGTGTVGANGAFDITTTATFADGSYTITATDASADGTLTSALSSPTTSVTLKTLASFVEPDDDDSTQNTGAYFPQAGLIADAAGDLFGTTAGGGTSEDGTVFEITDTNGVYATTPTVLASFSGSNGRSPQAGLIADAAGDLFGTTSSGGANGDGTVFEIKDANGVYASAPTVLASFTGSNGASPLGGLVADAAGDLFGTTLSGGSAGYGTVFEIKDNNGVYATAPTVLHSFTGTDGSEPYGSLIADAAGNLFGTTGYGGTNGFGTVFEIANFGTTTTPNYASAATMLYSFTGDSDGAFLPEAGLIADAAGDLFGTTNFSGASGDGTVFEIADANGTYTETTLASFNGTDGRAPKASLVANAAGNLYGTTTQGGLYNDGTIFEIVKNADGSFAATPTVLHSFNGADGSDPEASLLLAASGTLFGTTDRGGAGDGGTVFALTSQANQPTVVVGDTAPTNLAQVGATIVGGVLEVTGTGDVAGDLVTIYATPTSGGSAQAVATATVKSNGTLGFDAKSAAGALAGGFYDVTATEQNAGTTTQSPMSTAIVVTVNPTTETFYPDGHVKTEVFSNVTGQPFTGYTNTYSDSTGALTEAVYTGFTAGFASEDVTYNADASAHTVTVSGVTGAPYTAYTYTFGSGGKLVETDFNGFSGAAGYTTERVINNADGSTTTATYRANGSMDTYAVSGITGAAYTAYTNSYNANGVLTEADYAGFTSDFASEDITYNADGSTHTVQISGVTGAAYTGYTDTFVNRTLTEATLTGFSGTGFGAEDLTYYADGTVSKETLSSVTGQSYTQVAYGYADGTGALTETDYTGISGTGYTGEDVTYNPDGSAHTVAISGLTGAAYTGYTDTFNGGALTETDLTGFTSTGYGAEDLTYFADTSVATEAFSNVTGQSYTGVTYRFSDGTGALAETDYTGISGTGYTGEDVTYNPDGSAHTVAVSGVTGAAYTGYSDIFNAGKLAQTDLTGFTTAAYSEEDIGYDVNNGVVVSEAFINVTGQSYTGVEYGYDEGTGALTSATYSGISGTNYTGESVTYNADGSTRTVGVSGVTGAPFTGYVETFNSGAVTEISVSGVTGDDNGQFTVDGTAAPRTLLASANSYAGGTTLSGGTLELDAAQAAGTGAITFAGMATLQLDAAALTTSGSSSTFANTIGGATSTSQVIDLPSLGYSQGTTLALVNGSKLDVTNGTSDVMLNLASAPGVGKMFVTAADGSGGTLVYDPPATAASAKIDPSWIAAAMADFGGGGIVASAPTAHDPHGSTALAASPDAHASTMLGHRIG